MTHARLRNWGLLVLALAVAYPTLLSWVYFDLLAAQSAGLQQGVYAVGKIFQFSVPLLFLCLAPREPTRPGVVRPNGLWVSLPFGALVMAGIVFTVAGGPWPGLPLDALGEAVRAKVTGLGIATPIRYATVGVFYTIVHSFLEEYYFRWFLFGRLRRAMPLAPAVALSSIGFAAHHALLLSVLIGWNHPLTWLFSALIAVGGAVWAWIYDRSGSLLGPWLSHALVDAGIFIAGYWLLGGF